MRGVAAIEFSLVALEQLPAIVEISAGMVPGSCQHRRHVMRYSYVDEGTFWTV